MSLKLRRNIDGLCLNYFISLTNAHDDPFDITYLQLYIYAAVYFRMHKCFLMFLKENYEFWLQIHVIFHCNFRVSSADARDDLLGVPVTSQAGGRASPWQAAGDTSAAAAAHDQARAPGVHLSCIKTTGHIIVDCMRYTGKREGTGI